MPNDAQRIIAVTTRSRSRLARLRLTYPDNTEHPAYDAALARELLARTRELPGSKRALIVMLTEYRHALRDLATTRLTAEPPVITARATWHGNP